MNTRNHTNSACKKNSHCFCSLRPSRSATVMALLLAVLFPSFAASGNDAVYRNGFEESEGYTSGPLLDQGARPPAITQWVYPDDKTKGGADIVTDSAVNHLSAPQGSQMLQIRYGEENPGVLQNFLLEKDAIKQDFKVTFLLAVDAGVSGGTFNFAVMSSSGLNSGAWFGIRKVTGDPDHFGFFRKMVDSNGKIIFEKIGDGVFEPHQFYKVELRVNYGQLTYGGSVTDENGKEVLKFSDLPLLDHDGHLSAGRGFNRLYIGADQVGTKPPYLVDDIAVELLP